MNVLIFSELYDVSTNNVIGWLLKFGHSYFRINSEDTVDKVYISYIDKRPQIILEVRQRKINLDSFDCFWYRRGRLKFNSNLSFSSELDSNIKHFISYNLFNEEINTIEKYIEHNLLKKRNVGNFFQRNSNKLIAIEEANNVGLKTPKTIISTCKEDLMSFFKDNDNNCISKGVQDVLSFAIKKVGYSYYTSKISFADLEEMDNTFFPSLLQQNINKKYELRIFYINEIFYSMAIFSQLDSKTLVDFRNYNDIKPNRNTPFILPKEIENKLKKLMKKLNLDNGSIDMIVDKNNDYIFLEVNPSGQYGMVSIPCGYNLDKVIANKISYGL